MLTILEILVLILALIGLLSIIHNISEHCKYKKDTRLKKAPQYMCYCYDAKGNKYIVISIQPQHLVKILNGEKTIEVRKQIVNKLKELI